MRRGRAGIGRVKGGPKFGEKAEEIKAVSLASASEFNFFIRLVFLPMHILITQ